MRIDSSSACVLARVDIVAVAVTKSRFLPAQISEELMEAAQGLAARYRASLGRHFDTFSDPESSALCMLPPARCFGLEVCAGDGAVCGLQRLSIHFLTTEVRVHSISLDV